MEFQHPIVVLIYSLTVLYPYVIYTWAYTNPVHFLKHCSQKFLIDTSSYSHFFSFVLYGYICLQSEFLLESFLFSIPIIIIGQVLNFAVYKKLGMCRTYYGWELGLYNGELISGFPFKMGDAQYKGCMLTILGCFFSFKATLDVTVATLVWLIAYTYIIIIENLTPGRKA
ncbi:hypothetical protein TVAG_403800 [Trichomonas vaginalis G3]|uniref:phosphatidyl-N-methylethanolamine N-methyltransferase n=1 Tax=Trichomonas vaginalis (strain ATCC PRA-98 / G3) TaxID=412133 RepID=A2ELQ8_TRIV3|nr:phosphatidylethanolamine N-methyltransferase family [Trichomonas vaginalis G3]EAY06423.1 hypothetical protein TVAG_403800 [Trichomonas vaginalis G3]KAI5503011.1 phosphatidylethanolamine N-methyltransferase family [Trichomonas vaginalis G3]|eukprot:XP_001318646.1 hypothetical protein [Trichomonas vaginalis G3]